MRAVVDKVEGNEVRCLIENGDVLRFHKSHFPDGVKEGDVVRVKLELDAEATKRQQELMTSSAS